MEGRPGVEVSAAAALSAVPEVWVLFVVEILTAPCFRGIAARESI